MNKNLQPIRVFLWAYPFASSPWRNVDSLFEEIPPSITEIFSGIRSFVHFIAEIWWFESGGCKYVGIFIHKSDGDKPLKIYEWNKLRRGRPQKKQELSYPSRTDALLVIGGWKRMSIVLIALPKPLMVYDRNFAINIRNKISKFLINISRILVHVEENRLVEMICTLKYGVSS